MRAPTPLEGLSILLVEDNLLLAEVTKDLLEESGCRVVGPVGQLDSGLELAREAQLDGAILDINLHGELSFGIADVLRARDIPFVFVTGYRDLSIVPCALRSAPRLDKPVSDDLLIESVSEHFRARAA
jgi:CheY-like chemotaxis protein